MILLQSNDLVYKCIIKFFNICIMRIPMGILINTKIYILLKHLYSNKFFCYVYEENLGYSFIQNYYLCNTILIKFLEDKIKR